MDGILGWHDREKCEPVSHSQSVQFEIRRPSRAPLIRACGCAHRFQPVASEEKSLSVCRRRSRSCTPMQTHSNKTDTQAGKTKPKNESLTRHISENNLHQKQIIEIREVIELASRMCHRHRSDESCLRSQAIPYRYTTTIHVDLNSSSKQYIEEVSLQVCPTLAYNDCQPSYKATIETTIKQTLTGNANPIKKVVIQSGNIKSEKL